MAWNDFRCTLTNGPFVWLAQVGSSSRLLMIKTFEKNPLQGYKRHAFAKTINCDKISSVQVWTQTCHCPKS
jgi:hypothetical protein